MEVHTYPREPWLNLLDYPIPAGMELLPGTSGLSCVVGWPAPAGLKAQGLAAAATDHSHLDSFPILTPGSTQSAASLGHSTTSS